MLGAKTRWDVYLWFLGEHGVALSNGDVAVLWRIVSHLEAALAFGTWAQRVAALESLVKISLTAADDSVSLAVYELLGYAAGEEGSTLAGIAEPALILLDDIIAARTFVEETLNSPQPELQGTTRHWIGIDWKKEKKKKRKKNTYP